MTSEDFNWMAGGPQGSGVDTAANIFGRACGYGGYHLYGKREYHSNIKGLHSYFHFRVSTEHVAANVNRVDLLAAFDAETVVRHLREVASNGAVVLDSADLDTKIVDIPTLPPGFAAQIKESRAEQGYDTVKDLVEEAKKRNIQVCPVPFSDLLKNIAKELGDAKLSKVARMKNTLTIGISFGLLDFDVDLVEKAITTVFAAKPKIVDMNLLAFRTAYEHAKQSFGEGFHYKLGRLDSQEERIFLVGNQAVALGKILGGCRIQTYYPITPAADESEFLEEHEVFKLKQGDGAIVVFQAEDELAAVNMASGATLAGARAATSTSGPGFSLMAEGLSWAGNNEVPLVITYYQRGAPSTGLPTRHGQDDLRFAIHAGHGEFPRIVLASGDMKECFYDAASAFNYAERYQMPVIHLVDKALGNTTQSYTVFDVNQVKIDRGEIVDSRRVPDSGYKRFKATNSHLSPRAFLGTESAVMWYTGDEHDEMGHVNEEPSNRVRMMEKRMGKLEMVNRETPVQEKLNFFGQSTENIVVSWGSPKGAILEAMKRLEREGFKLAFLQVRMIHPLPSKKVSEYLANAETRIAVEMNYSGQLASVISEKTGFFMNYFVLKYNGRPMTSTEVYEALKKILRGGAPKRQVLTYGS